MTNLVLGQMGTRYFYRNPPEGDGVELNVYYDESDGSKRGIWISIGAHSYKVCGDQLMSVLDGKALNYFALRLESFDAEQLRAVAIRLDPVAPTVTKDFATNKGNAVLNLYRFVPQVP